MLTSFQNHQIEKLNYILSSSPIFLIKDIYRIEDIHYTTWPEAR